jgi:hypothetical protein
MRISGKHLPTCFTVIFFLVALTPAVSFTAGANLNTIVPLTQGFPFDRPANSRVAFNSKHNEFLIVYEYTNELLPNLHEIHATRRSATGEFLEFFKLGDPAKINKKPDVCYDSFSDQYMVVWQSFLTASTSDNYTMAQRIPWSGFDAGILPLKAIKHPVSPASESVFEPRVAYNSKSRDFLVISPIRQSGNSRISITGVLVNGMTGQFIGTGKADFDFSGGYSKASMHPEIVYNPAANEYFIVYDDFADVWGVRISGLDGHVHSLERPIATWGGVEIFPSISYLQSQDVYLIAWTGRATPSATYQIYYRHFNTQGIAVGGVVPFSNDPPNDNFSPTILCNASGERCSIVWAVNNNSGIYLMEKTFSSSLYQYEKQRLLHYLGPANAFQPPFLEIGGAAGGNRLFMSYAGIDNRGIQMLFGRGGLFHFLNPGILLLL